MEAESSQKQGFCEACSWIVRALICADHRSRVYLLQIGRTTARPLLSVSLSSSPTTIHLSRQALLLVQMQPLPSIKHLLPDELFYRQLPAQHDHPLPPSPPPFHRRSQSDLTYPSISHRFYPEHRPSSSVVTPAQSTTSYPRQDAVAYPYPTYHAHPPPAPQPRPQPCPSPPIRDSRYPQQCIDPNPTYYPSVEQNESRHSDSRGWVAGPAPRVAREDRDRCMRSHALALDDDEAEENAEEDAFGPSGQPRGKHACSYCNKSFNRPSSLRIHELTHTGDKRE